MSKRKPRPEPPIDAHIDVRRLPYMPLHTETLITSDFASIMSGEAFKAALLLWCHSWHQVPAASLPNDDRVLARLSGAGSRWRELRKEALYGFVLCSDGRLYHPLIAELAVTAWTSSDHQRRRSVAGWKKRMAHAPASKIDAKEVKGRNLKRTESRALRPRSPATPPARRPRATAALSLLVEKNPIHSPTARPSRQTSSSASRQHGRNCSPIPSVPRG